MSVRRYIRSHSSQLMTGCTVMMLVIMATVPPLNSYTSRVFHAFWESVRGGAHSWLFLLALAVLLVGIWLNNMLQRLSYDWLEWSAFSKKSNAIYALLNRKWLGWPYLAVLVFCMPLLALMEEIIFRQLASQLGLVVLLLVSGPIFGLVHISSGVTMRMSIYLSLVGLLMAWVFLVTGLAGVFVFHASYNLIAITWVTFELRIRAPLGDLLNRFATTRRHLPTVTAWLLQPQTTAIH